MNLQDSHVGKKVLLSNGRTGTLLRWELDGNLYIQYDHNDTAITVRRDGKTNAYQPQKIFQDNYVRVVKVIEG